jgi:hypothetical protein
MEKRGVKVVLDRLTLCVDDRVDILEVISFISRHPYKSIFPKT